MSTAYQTFDRNERESGQHFRAIDKRTAWAELREGRDDLPSVETLTNAYGLTTAAANHVLKGARCVFKFRHFLDVLVGLQAVILGARVDWFEATDAEISEAAGRSKKWVQETRKDFIVWQKRYNYAFADVESHKYRTGEIPKCHRYRVHLSSVVAGATLDALTASDTGFDMSRIIKDAAIAARDSLPETARYINHGGHPRRDAEKDVNRNLRTATTNINRALEVRAQTGNAVEFSPVALQELKAAVARLEKSLQKQPVIKTKERVAVFVEPFDGTCSRCESVGHTTETCPMPDTEETRRIAQERRKHKLKVVEPFGGVVEESSTTPTNTQENQQDTDSADNSPPVSDFSPEVLTDDDYTQHDHEFWQCVEQHVADGQDRNHATKLAHDEIGTISDWYARRRAKGGSDGWIH